MGGGDGVGTLLIVAGRASKTLRLSSPPPPRGLSATGARRKRCANAPSPHGARMFFHAYPPEPTPSRCPSRALGLSARCDAPFRAKCPSLPPQPYGLLALLTPGWVPPHLCARFLHRTFGGAVARLHRLGGPAGSSPTSSSFSLSGARTPLLTPVWRMLCVAKGTSTHPFSRAQVVKAVLARQETSSGKSCAGFPGAGASRARCRASGRCQRGTGPRGGVERCVGRPGPLSGPQPGIRGFPCAGRGGGSFEPGMAVRIGRGGGRERSGGGARRHMLVCTDTRPKLGDID